MDNFSGRLFSMLPDEYESGAGWDSGLDRGWSRKVAKLNILGEAAELRCGLTKTTTPSLR